MSFDWKSTIGKVAPWIATALGGPAAGLAIDAVCKAAGLAPSLENAQKAAEMAAAGSLTGEQFLALRQSEDAFKIKMMEMGYKQITDLEDIAFKDRDSARNMMIQTKDNTPRLLAFYALVVWTLMNGTLLGMAFMGKSLPTDMSPIIMRVLGTMDALLGMAFAFFLGTTANSRNKDMLIYNSTPTDK